MDVGDDAPMAKDHIHVMESSLNTSDSRVIQTSEPLHKLKRLRMIDYNFDLTPNNDVTVKFVNPRTPNIP